MQSDRPRPALYSGKRKVDGGLNTRASLPSGDHVNQSSVVTFMPHPLENLDPMQILVKSKFKPIL